MPLFPLPPDDTGLAGGDLPVTDGSDVLKEFGRPHKNPTVAPVRDAFVEAFAEGFKEYQLEAEYVAAQRDPLRATGDQLRDIAEEHRVFPVPGEDEESIRARLFTPPDIVTPEAIRAAVDNILSQHTSAVCQVSEPELDGWFVGDGTETWGSYIEEEPDYQDRLYIHNADENDGDFIPQNLPGGAVPSDGTPRLFLVRVPVLESDELSLVDEDVLFFIGDGTDASGSESDGSVATSIYGDSLTEEEIFNAIIGVTESIKGQGIAWTLLADPNLV